MSEKRRRGFVTGGTWCLDRNRKIDAWPREDSVAVTWGLEERGGGSACNLGIDMRRLDPSMPVETIGVVGGDAAGRRLLAEADAAGIDRRQMAVDPSVPTHITEAFISQESGLRTHVTDFGSSVCLTPDHFDFAATTGRFMHLGLPGVHPKMDGRWGDDPSGWVTVLKAARAAGLKTNLELCTLSPQRLRELIIPCLPHLDTLVVNDSEIGALAEIETVKDGKSDLEASRMAAKLVLMRGSMWLVAVHFPNGAFTLTRDGSSEFVPSVSVPKEVIVGPNGAGDAFAAGFLYGLHEDWPLEDSLWLGHAAAACSLRTAGTTDGLEGWRSCIAVAEAFGRRAMPSL